MENQHSMTSLTHDILGNEGQLLDLSSNLPTTHTLGAHEVRMNKVFEMWAEPEIHILLDLFEEKWLENNRGNFASEHWKWIAKELGGRYKSSQGRSAVQCKSKIEKMRRKYRDEKRLSEQTGIPSRWEFFDRMAELWRYRPKSTCSRDSADNMMHDLEMVIPTHSDFRERDAPTPYLYIDRETSISTPSRKKATRETEDIDSAKPKSCGVSGFAGRYNGKRTKKTRAVGELVEVMKSFANSMMKIEESKMELLKDMAREQRESAREQRELAREQRESHERMITLVLQTIMSIQEMKHMSKKD
ncbi:hypothetical protein O6H91_09G111500 [Diphasiastrum complanatum]|uniref:Uncharacterized protein n=2 Tax=Diphasiastrum complanatum TaxID=34168 RepID=A0ACC2CTM8_DIPCM|nr:hypothetical protein O6H91_09G111500 [Diphasiastrum complanatum]KAJ7545230.1 hypothetical protein O6H91_09G111500 [Diphasiastrum complanatum]